MLELQAQLARAQHDAASGLSRRRAGNGAAAAAAKNAGVQARAARDRATALGEGDLAHLAAPEAEAARQRALERKAREYDARAARGARGEDDDEGGEGGGGGGGGGGGRRGQDREGGSLVDFWRKHEAGPAAPSGRRDRDDEDGQSQQELKAQKQDELRRLTAETDAARLAAAAGAARRDGALQRAKARVLQRAVERRREEKAAAAAGLASSSRSEK